MESIERISKIPKAALDSEFYMKSLLEQAYNLEMIGSDELERIQVDSLKFLAELTERYNKGESSSIVVETAKELLDSIMFTVGLQLKTYAIPDDALAALQNTPISELYTAGRGRIDSLVRSAKTVQALILRNLLRTPNDFYVSTIKDGVNRFFKLYRPDFFAHEIHITADYPVFNQMEKFLGIEFIKKYLENLHHENMFCTLFPAAEIHGLLTGFEKDYKGLTFNIYQQVLTAALGCVILQRDVQLLDMTPAAVRQLTEGFDKKSYPEILAIITKAAEQLPNTLRIGDALFAYLTESLPQIAATIETHSRRKQLDKVFIAKLREIV